jgi:hypothetical protein
MSFECPECSATPGSLRIEASIELPSDIRSDEITLQIVSCSHCHFEAVAVYEESRRGRLDNESVDHTGFRVGKENVGTLRRLIGQCPSPRKSSCRCRAHRALGGRDAGGRWNGLRRYCRAHRALGGRDAGGRWNGLRRYGWEGVFPIRIQR